MAVDPDPECPCSGILQLISHVSGSSVQFPDGQSEAPRAEHCPAQLFPWPQVATSNVLVSWWQQVTFLERLAKVKVLSKESTEEVVAVLPGHHCLANS